MEINENELLKRLMISDASFLTTSEKNLLTKKLDSSDNLALMSNNELSSIIQRDLGRSIWNGREIQQKANIANALINRLGINYVFIDSAEYPAMLREMKDPPYVIFYRGNLDCLKEQCVSLVGTRQATYTARNAAFDFSKEASDDGTTVVSGLALGIDICSHRGALAGSIHKTAAVLPGGIDTIVPGTHKRDAVKIIENGGIVLSEYTPGTPAKAFRFVQRNRIIAALSPATVVVQAPAGSGSMITAGLALDYNRYVFFHSVCLNEESKALKRAVEQKLMALAKTGKAGEKKAESKLLNSPERYIEDGAPVINSYEEYCLHRSEGFIDIKNNEGQLNLFQ